MIAASVIAGFLLIPIHELGHVACDWITGHPAAMSYARDYLLSGMEPPFLGVLGGPLLPMVVAAVSILLIYLKRDPSVFYPIAFIGSIDRLVFYLMGTLPSDERNLADMAGWNIHSFQWIFLACEVVLLASIAVSFFKNRVSMRHAALVVLVSLAGFVVGAAAGIFGVEKYLFPVQYQIQFGR